MHITYGLEKFEEHHFLTKCGRERYYEVRVSLSIINTILDHFINDIEL